MVAAYAGMRSEQALEMHITGALNSGATQDEIGEVIYHVSLYAGMDAMTEALAVYRALFG